MLTTLALLVFFPFWVAVFFFCGALLCYVSFRLSEKIILPELRKWVNTGLRIFFVALFSVLFKILFVDVYYVPSDSMENALFPGDVILLNKLAWGPKLPNSVYDISWINIFFNKNFDNSRRNVQEVQRLKGTTTVKQGDIMIFEVNSLSVVKRCIAVAGDTLRIVDGEIYRGEMKYTDPVTVKNRYIIKMTDPDRYYRVVDSFKKTDAGDQFNFADESITGNFSKQEIFNISLNYRARALKIIEPYDKSVPLFANPVNKKWTLDNIDTLIIPRKGMRIALNELNYEIYKGTIVNCENVNLVKKGNNFFIKNALVKTYTFTHNYYFVMGDNRKHSADSRYGGFLPDDHVVGKVEAVLYSFNDGIFSWNRLFKNLN